MDTPTAKRIVIGSMVVVVLASTVRRIANDQPPTVRAPIGGLLAGAGLTALAGPAPSVAAQLALIALVAELVTDGPYLILTATAATKQRETTAPVVAGLNQGAQALALAVATATGSRWWQSGIGATQLGDAGTDIANAATSAANKVGQVTWRSATGQLITSSPRFRSALAPMIAAALEDGVRLTGSAWRSPAAQINLRKKNCPDWRNSPASACTPATAKPGTSQHEIGEAIDFDNCATGSPVHRWLTANAGRWGLRQLPSESWHWSLTGT